jgi:hypothetical protein
VLIAAEDHTLPPLGNRSTNSIESDWLTDENRTSDLASSTRAVEVIGVKISCTHGHPKKTPIGRAVTKATGNCYTAPGIHQSNV